MGDDLPQNFVDMCKRTGIPPEQAQEMFDDMKRAMGESTSSNTPCEEKDAKQDEGTVRIRTETEYYILPGLRCTITPDERELLKKGADECMLAVERGEMTAKEARKKLGPLHAFDCTACGTQDSLMGRMTPGISIDSWISTTPTMTSCFSDTSAIEKTEGDTVHIKEDATSSDYVAWDIDIETRPIALCPTCAARTCKIHNTHMVLALIREGKLPPTFKAMTEPASSYPESHPKISEESLGVLMHITWDQLGDFAERFSQFAVSQLAWNNVTPGPIIDTDSKLTGELAKIFDPTPLPQEQANVGERADYAAFYNVMFRPSPSLLAKGQLPKCAGTSCGAEILDTPKHFLVASAAMPFSIKHKTPQFRVTYTPLRFCSKSCKDGFVAKMGTVRKVYTASKGRFCMILEKIHRLIGRSPQIPQLVVPVAPVCSLCPSDQNVPVAPFVMDPADSRGQQSNKKNWCERCSLVPICPKHKGKDRVHPHCSKYPSHFILSANAQVP